MFLVHMLFCQLNASSSPIKAVIFDCDGTLVDTEKVLCEAWKHAFSKQGYQLSDEEYWKVVNEHSLAGLPRGDRIIASWGCRLLNRECADELIDDTRAYMKSHKIPAIEPTVAFLRTLADAKEELGIKIGLASGGRKHTILFYLRELGIEHHFDVILSGYDDLADYQDAEGTNKPKPYVYIHTAKELGIHPSECVAIEDSRTGVTSAVNAGCITIAVPNRATQSHDLSCAHLKIDSFSDMDIATFLQVIKGIGRTLEPLPTYTMVTAHLHDGEVVFNSQKEFDEAMSVGFFRIETPKDLDVEVGRAFARTFTSNPRYNSFGMIDQINGFLRSDIAQSVRFALERDYWNRPAVDEKPIFPPEIQELGNKMQAIGIKVLQCILRKFALPEELWFKATAGASHNEGSHYLLFNCYDPKDGPKQDGLAEHTDWGHITVLDANAPGLQAKVHGIWQNLATDEGYLIINFGGPLEKFLPQVKASEHRVLFQTEKMRTSTVAFIDPRAGPFREGVKAEDKEGHVYDWDPVNKALINGQTTNAYIADMNDRLFKKNY